MIGVCKVIFGENFIFMWFYIEGRNEYSCGEFNWGNLIMLIYLYGYKSYKRLRVIVL